MNDQRLLNYASNRLRLVLRVGDWIYAIFPSSHVAVQKLADGGDGASLSGRVRRVAGYDYDRSAWRAVRCW
jgi:hypothetical protein